MATLKVSILGLDRLGASIALRLREYEKNGKQRFQLAGYESREDYEKPARKLKVLDKVERQPGAAVRSADLVIMNLPYEDLRAGYELVAPFLREGVVILDTAVIKLPSAQWAAEFLTDAQHMIGFTAVVNADYMLDHQLGAEYATEDYFRGGTIYLSPTAASNREAIDLAVNFALILDGKPHFLDPAEHDSLTTITEEIPQLLSVAAYSAAMEHNAWGDAQRLTNPPFNVLTRYLLTHHPDALRDEWLANSDALARAIDDIVGTLRELRECLADGDESAVEAFLIQASDDYQKWINRRHKGDWEDMPASRMEFDNSVTGALFGSAISRRLFGGNNDRDS
ncbi:MAG: prephenate dehydrogenase/arogenate dehydrogenase family protein [Chloroflexota bacterium]|nr:prephenate dehydrogenase/arogenate dehydrogenase family protein [Chloroflexota bacterium]MDE2945881.1 prephenate dehydrogenase/arogenate dehydrogenase family protein [Chloroflexota bacterium]